ncbi:phage portal protein [Sporosarcina sp. P37]|uniref:phage tail assembly chaperone n=1 Tax=unclassified Sporosarcina TaxID=2647733 RepID=UPI000A17BE3E|nr:MULTISPECIES: phage portal protein [unclassified Sporosarcina]ARK26111.1 phage portal protein [Sporosarcina sp. P37]PID19670.1 phage portal protein [Sporosarcina sp. P35]
MELSQVVDDLSFFLPENVEETEEVALPVSRRFKDKEGKVIPFRFKAISTARVEEIEKMCMEPVYTGSRKKKIGEQLNNARYMALIAVETTLYPNFRSAELRKAYKQQDPIDVAKKMLHVAGEYAEWLKAANEVNGFDDTLEDLEEAAKN